mmetsp:Transcript_6832/g.12230  ORF Transcript_6832/g.12230 Transcript_6832/m.12230 type:complete len:349 (-) Transcript_6832:1035-2081(-)|eukprot:CAMPEP_0182446952 /NCGR_PEP_ID=MMETSP1172-20130603/9221_1 /TAXON_ID=708627 /ORGANISM="Timspurckia oligopyrenoides, Strain CCMP3278" /LENGTH=348 /DNA_ID=CAMNT_0024643155 /DNA_START=95 /DNA_END=1141 /DNA_ORIENTATION=-
MEESDGKRNGENTRTREMNMHSANRFGSQRLGSVGGPAAGGGSLKVGSQRLAVGSQRLNAAGSQRLSSVRLRKMTETVLKEPALYLVDYGTGNWARDTFAWPHNAIRREMSDMYYLVASMQKRVLDLGHEDIDDFYNWFDIFQMFVQWYFQIEEKLLLPWVEGATYLGGMLEESARTELKAKLISRLKDIDDCQDRFSHLPAGEVLPALIVALDKFSPGLLEYFNEEEKSLAAEISNTYTQKDKELLDARVFDFIRNSEDHHIVMHLLLRPIKDSETKTELRKKYLANGNFLQKLRFKRTYEKSRKEFREGHVDIVKQFYKRWGNAKTEALAEEERLNQDVYGGGKAF